MRYYQTNNDKMVGDNTMDHYIDDKLYKQLNKRTSRHIQMKMIRYIWRKMQMKIEIHRYI